MSETVLPPLPLTEEKPNVGKPTMVVSSLFHLVYPYAWTGNDQLVAQIQTTPHAISAQAAEDQIMVHRCVLEHRKSNALTPYNHEAWTTSLQCHHLNEQYSNIPQGIQEGFSAGICRIICTYVPPNGSSVEKHADIYQEIEDKEFRKGRYLSPFFQCEVEGLIGPFQSSPLSLVPKPSKLMSLCTVHNFSSPHSPLSSISSINSSININNFSCTWGTFNTVASLISNLPPGSQASICDVAEAYHMIPIISSEWPGLVIQLQGSDRFAINTSNNFGLSLAGGVYGHLADAGADIFWAEGIGPLSKWVDDHIFFRIPKKELFNYNQLHQDQHRCITENSGYHCKGSRIWYCGSKMVDDRLKEFNEDNSRALKDLSSFSSPDCLYTYSDVDIDNVSNHLGIPWEGSKTVPFGPVVPYLGFRWDLDAKTVSLLEHKKEKYLLCISEWCQRHTHTLIQVQSLYGNLFHSCLVIEGQAYLTSLEAMLSIC